MRNACTGWNLAPRFGSAAEFASHEFDYIVIGGGTAGLVVAARLSEDPGVSVGVVEAGQYLPDDPLIDTPRSAGSLQGNSKYDWMFETIPQPNLNNRVLPIPRGKGLVDQAINFMAFDRASKKDMTKYRPPPVYEKGGAIYWYRPIPHPTRVPQTAIYPSQGRNGPIAASFNGKRKATGVSFVSNSTSYRAYARKEVILAAGAIQSPQILELSDHPGISASYELKPGSITFDALRNNATFAAQAQAQYASTHDGIYATAISILSFINLQTFISKPKLDAMRKQLDREIAASKPSRLQDRQFKIQKSWLDQKLGHVELIFNPAYYSSGVPKANASYLGMLMVLQHPFSRGSVHINSSDPLARPVYDPNYLSKSLDQDSLVEALKFSKKISETEPMASLIAGRQDPAPDLVTDAQLLNYTKTFARTVHHPIGTLVMADEKLGGVVGSDLKVYGTSNLRVVDASIIPLHMGTHLSRTVYGIGEKAAALIKSE
ncbi:GMC oxidoreductase [Ceratobasidium sp. AG-Ba]|nr:GMC oxidoreductase [Ceratobasidium sp. AG-Ba]